MIAGSVEVYTLSWEGLASWSSTIGRYTLPALVGNTVGGVAFVAVLAHVQFVEGADAQDL